MIGGIILVSFIAGSLATIGFQAIEKALRVPMSPEAQNKVLEAIRAKEGR